MNKISVIFVFLSVFILTAVLSSAQEPVSETPCAVSCNVPGLPPTVCGEDIHRWHDNLNMCTNYGYVEIPEVGPGMVVGNGPCNIRWSDGTRFALNCAYGNCEGSGKMYCGGVLHDVNLSCAGGPRGDQSDVARATIDHGLMTCNGFGNGMEAKCNNGTFIFISWD
jgi:hypothetical protein